MSRALSVDRPTPLRLAGFLGVALGAVAVGVGALREWVSVGFPGDAEGAADVPVHGTDVWEGKVVLLGAAVALIALVAMRLARSDGTRRILAILLIVVGAAGAALPIVDATGAEDRFGGAGGVDRMAETLAAELELPEDVVREQLAEQFARQLRIDVAPWLWLTAAGGLVLAAGGVLSLMWAGREAARARDVASGVEPEPGDAA